MKGHSLSIKRPQAWIHARKRSVKQSLYSSKLQTGFFRSHFVWTSFEIIVISSRDKTLNNIKNIYIYPCIWKIYVYAYEYTYIYLFRWWTLIIETFIFHMIYQYLRTDMNTYSLIFRNISCVFLWYLQWSRLTKNVFFSIFISVIMTTQEDNRTT